MIRVALIGSTGYTALEVARMLTSHPGATLTAATSRSEEGQPLASIHPILTGRCDVTVEAFDPAALAKQADVAMCCLPHGAAAQSVRELVDAGMRVIDFSADFRLSSLDVYEQTYGVTHPWPTRVGSVVYGLPEFYAEAIATADVVANPGCYPTSVILPLAPLVKAGLIDVTDVIVDSKSGVSGAGRSAKLGTLYCEVNESIAAYAIGQHRHLPEMRDLIHRVSDQPIDLIFTPHLTPMDRGILSTIYVRPAATPGDATTGDATRGDSATTDSEAADSGAAGGAVAAADAMMRCLHQTYDSTPFVHVVDHLPSTKHVATTNHVQMTVRASGDRCVIVCVIDNLIKGASGAAIQNMNVMFGLDQTLGL